MWTLPRRSLTVKRHHITFDAVADGAPDEMLLFMTVVAIWSLAFLSGVGLYEGDIPWTRRGGRHV